MFSKLNLGVKLEDQDHEDQMMIEERHSTCWLYKSSSCQKTNNGPFKGKKH